MIEVAEIVSDGIILVFHDGNIIYYPAALIRKLDNDPGCQHFVEETPATSLSAKTHVLPSRNDKSSE